MTLLNFILKDCFILTQALKRLRSLKEFMSGKLYNQEKIQPENWINTIPQQFLDEITTANFEKTFTDLETTLRKIPILTIYIPFETNDNTITEISTKVRQDFGSNFLIDFKIDPKLIGGAAIVWKGVYHDYSLHQKIVEKRDAILQMFKEYAKT